MPHNQEAFVTSEHLLLPACSVAAGTLAAASHHCHPLPPVHSHTPDIHPLYSTLGRLGKDRRRQRAGPRGQRGLPEANMETVTMISQKLTVPVSMWLVLVATTRKLSMSLWTELPQALSRQGCS